MPHASQLVGLEGCQKGDEVAMAEHGALGWACGAAGIRECDAVLLCDFDALVGDKVLLFLG